MGDDDDDEDRHAILARRNRFVAIALSGLTSLAPACGDDREDVSPQPCLEPVQMTPIEPIEQPKPPELPPEPCLEIAPPPETAMTGEVTPMMDPPPPRTCLRVRPRVCLRRAPARMDPPPHPCLDYPAPQVCLEFVEKPGGWDDDDPDDEDV